MRSNRLIPISSAFTNVCSKLIASISASGSAAGSMKGANILISSCIAAPQR
ncbi:exported hypothetical protein [Cupriavidus taiwanensis]|nr:exported hypothetical protein [Cupriavidus taiwanensis]